MKYQVIGTIKVRTKSGVRELKSGDLVALPEDMAKNLLEQGRIKTIVPHFDIDDSLVIPFASDPRFHYWNGGQSVETTEKEVRSWKH
ncbi:MAG: hypothetical protein A3J24_01530 [Deltaproteobacteria bacterium RIFCSPLOWO2_02_FULL_53_8]|nr:MAG: hypothetical protein A3J24_01530 [Deltaproteobacteria bacterium RIFCSPLOWO2_02_FULL_53_8]